MVGKISCEKAFHSQFYSDSDLRQFVNDEMKALKAMSDLEWPM